MTLLRVISPGGLTTIQDLGRPGLGRWGVARSGAADRASLKLANRLVGNPEATEAFENQGGGFTFDAEGPVTIAVTGATCPVSVDERLRGPNVAIAVPPAAVVRVGPVTAGIRVYVSIRGGLDIAPVLGSRSFDQLGGIGPPPLRPGEQFHIAGRAVGLEHWEPVPRPAVVNPALLRVLPGPRLDWLEPPGLESLLGIEWTVSPVGNRTGLRLDGPPLARRRGDLETEAALAGAVQVLPSGRPIVLGPDAGVTGGYPAVAVVVDADLDLVGQLGPGDRVRFAAVTGGQAISSTRP